MTTFIIILEQSLLYIPLLLGAYISFSLMKVPDLSIESAYLFGALCASYALHIPIKSPLGMLGITLLSSAIGGLLVGAISSCITYFGKIPHLLSSIITFGLCHGIFQLLSPPYVSLAAFHNPLSLMPHVPKHPELMVIAALSVFLTTLYAFFSHTQLGYCIKIFGDNPQFFNYFAPSTPFVFISGIMLANALAGISGYLFAQTSNLIDINMGTGKALFCITALILGKTIIRNKKIDYLIPLGGAAFYFLLQQFLLKMGFNLKYFTTIQAFLIFMILLIMHKKANTKINLLGI